MAIRIVRIDDIDGTDGAELVGFVLDKVEYEIDLAPRNRAKFLRGIQPFVERARPIETTIVAKDPVDLPTSKRRHRSSADYDDGHGSDSQAEGADIAKMARQIR